MTDTVADSTVPGTTLTPGERREGVPGKTPSRAQPVTTTRPALLVAREAAFRLLATASEVTQQLLITARSAAAPPGTSTCPRASSPSRISRAST